MSWWVESEVLEKRAIQNVQWRGCLQDRFEKHCFNGLFFLWETINTTFSVLLQTTKQQPLRRCAVLIHVAVLSVSCVDRLIASRASCENHIHYVLLQSVMFTLTMQHCRYEKWKDEFPSSILTNNIQFFFSHPRFYFKQDSQPCPNSPESSSLWPRCFIPWE